MGTYLVYVDESYDDTLFCLSAMILKATEWREAFKTVKDHREQLKERHGIPLRKEIHARNLVGGRGQLGPSNIGKWERSRLFRGLLELVTTLPSARLFNVALPVSGETDPQLKAWDRLLNRVDRTLKNRETQEQTARRKIHEVVAKHAPALADSAELRLRWQGRALFVADEGRNVEITRVMRKMNVHNPIPSAYGGWPEGAVRNTPTERVIEDPVFRNSESSYMLQLVDCVAFALLKRETVPTANIKRYGIHNMFDETVAGICVKAASKTDPLGIVRK
jgi:hypothetical protein